MRPGPVQEGSDEFRRESHSLSTRPSKPGGEEVLACIVGKKTIVLRSSPPSRSRIIPREKAFQAIACDSLQYIPLAMLVECVTEMPLHIHTIASTGHVHPDLCIAPEIDTASLVILGRLA